MSFLDRLLVGGAMSLLVAVTLVAPSLATGQVAGFQAALLEKIASQDPSALFIAQLFSHDLVKSLGRVFLLGGQAYTF